VLDWPYVEGLRLDEAMHPLTLLAVGLYGEVLPNQNGAPIRLVVPWKYGFKSAKSIVKMRFVEKQPTSSWMAALPREYASIPTSIRRSITALEPGEGAPHRRIPQARHADVQRLRRAGCPVVSRHGSEEVLLMGAPLRNPKFWIFGLCLLPLLRLIVLVSAAVWGESHRVHHTLDRTGRWSVYW